MQPVNSGQIIYSDWLVAPELAAQLYALGLARHLDPPSADENSQGKGLPLLMSTVIVTGLSLNQNLESLGCSKV